VDGWHVFISYAAATFYTSSNAVVLGLVSGMTQVGYFSAAYKVFVAGQMLVSPMGQAMYPHVCALADRSRELAVTYLRKAMIVIGGLTFVGGLLVIVLAKVIVHIAMGPKYAASVLVLQLLAMIPFVFSLNNIYGTQAMLNFGLKVQFSRIMVISALFNNIILVPLCFWFKAPGAAVSALITQTAMTIAMGMTLYGRGIDLLPRLADLRGHLANLSLLAQRSYEKVCG
jgi:PST family polysaccharide transporter